VIPAESSFPSASIFGCSLNGAAGVSLLSDIGFLSFRCDYSSLGAWEVGRATSEWLERRIKFRFAFPDWEVAVFDVSFSIRTF